MKHQTFLGVLPPPRLEWTPNIWAHSAGKGSAVFLCWVGIGSWASVLIFLALFFKKFWVAGGVWKQKGCCVPGRCIPACFFAALSVGEVSWHQIWVLVKPTPEGLWEELASHSHYLAGSCWQVRNTPTIFAPVAQCRPLPCTEKSSLSGRRSLLSSFPCKAKTSLKRLAFETVYGWSLQGKDKIGGFSPWETSFLDARKGASYGEQMCAFFFKFMLPLILARHKAACSQTQTFKVLK